eukprot:7622379-Pyramimonas_sp.AAC.1
MASFTYPRCKCSVVMHTSPVLAGMQNRLLYPPWDNPLQTFLAGHHTAHVPPSNPLQPLIRLPCRGPNGPHVPPSNPLHPLWTPIADVWRDGCQWQLLRGALCL